MSEELEIKGLKERELLLVELLNKLNKNLILETDPSREFKLECDIQDNKKELKKIRDQLAKKTSILASDKSNIDAQLLKEISTKPEIPKSIQNKLTRLAKQEKELKDLKQIRQIASDKEKYDNLIDELEDKIERNQSLIKHLQESHSQDFFLELLFRYFQTFNFHEQRSDYDSYRNFSSSNIGAFVIYSEGNYKKLEQQFWLWKGVLLSYLDDTDIEIVSTFFEDGIYEFRQLYSKFQAALFNGFFDKNNFDEHIGIAEIEELSCKIEKKLETKNVIIPIYLTTQMGSYNHIYQFIEEVWKPLYALLSNRENKNHWLKLFIIDNEIEDIDGKDYHSTELLQSIEYGIPFKLKKACFNSNDMKLWLEFQKHYPTNSTSNIFYQFKNDCQSFINKFTAETHYISYLPNCKTIENLFDKICDDLPNHLVCVNLEKLTEKYASKYHKRIYRGKA